MPARRDFSPRSIASRCPRARGRSRTRRAPWPGASGHRGRAHAPLSRSGSRSRRCINHALASVAAGTHDTVVVVGGEARRWAPCRRHRGRPRARAARRASWRGRPTSSHPSRSQPASSCPPVQQYALIENAMAASRPAHPGRAARPDRRALGPLQRRGGRQSRCRLRHGARRGRDRHARSAQPAARAIPTTSGTRSQWTVDQSSALVICSAARAAEAGVPLDRWLFPHVALHCSTAVTLTARRELGAWPAMAVLGRVGGAAPRPALARARARRGLLLLPGGGPGAAA